MDRLPDMPIRPRSLGRNEMTEITQADRDAECWMATLPREQFDHLLRLIERQVARHRLQERAAIVAWLRGKGLASFAMGIEAWEHLK